MSETRASARAGVSQEALPDGRASDIDRANLSEVRLNALESMGMNLKEQIVADVTVAMKAKDAARTSTLRMLKAAIVNRQIEKGGELDEEELMKLLRTQVKQRRDSVEQYEKGGRQDLADKEIAEIAVIEGYLPQAASQAEIDEAVAAAIAETGATSVKEMGAVMKAVMPRLAGKNADGRAVSETVKKKLTPGS